jgi:hypothetical protein
VNRTKQFRLVFRILIIFVLAPVWLTFSGTVRAESQGKSPFQANASPVNLAPPVNQFSPPVVNSTCFGDVQFFEGVDYSGACEFVFWTGYTTPLPGFTVESVIIATDGWSVRFFKNDDIHGPQTCITDNDPNLWDNYFNDGTVVANNVSLTGVFDTPDCPPPSLPNLVPYTPAGWDFPIVPSTAQGTTTTSTLYANENTYIDFAYMNAGIYTTTNNFRTCLYFDATELQCETIDLWQNETSQITDVLLSLTPTEGWHTLKVITDVDQVIVESNENDNLWERNFYWEGESPFHKIAPADFSNVFSTDVSLSWSSVSDSTSYEYCITMTFGGNCDTGWVTANQNTSVTVTDLTPHDYENYYWQVRALHGMDAIYADGGGWWRFRLRDTRPPGDFTKTGPANGAEYLPTSLTLSWNSSPRAGWYYFCYYSNNSNDCSGEWPMTASFNVALNNLQRNTTYHWQVRAYGTTGTTYADGGTWWTFTTWNNLPAAFSKVNPPDGTVSVSTTPTISWTSSSEVLYYEYCYDKSDNDLCSNWIYAGNNTQASLSNLDYGATYFWQARAVNGGGSTDASDDYHSFTVVARPPGPFVKTGPANGATGVSTSPILGWQGTSPVTQYQYCYSEDDESCENWISNGLSTFVTLTNLSNNTTYYWQVRAVNNDSEPTYANGSLVAFGSFTTLPPTWQIFIPFVSR